MRMSASSSTMRISLAMPCSSFHSRHLVVVVRLPAAAVGHFFAQREDEADDRAATFPVAQNQIAAVILHDLLHNCEAKSSEIGRASCRERVCQYGYISGVAV